MLTGNVCCSECIHMASTNKQNNTISMLWLHGEMGEKKGDSKIGRESSQTDGVGFSANSSL